MGLISFILYNFSNIIFIVLLPSFEAKTFLNFYSLGSGIFSFLIFYNYSKKKFLNLSLVIILSIAVLLISLKYSILSVLIFLYVFLLLYSDYFFSQSDLYKTNLIFKFFLFLSSFLLLFNFSLYFVIQLKIGLIIFFLVISFFYNVSFKYLKVKSPLLYSAYTCLIYFGALFLTSILADKDTVKIFYVCLQIFLGLKLKIFDLKVREIKFELFNIDKVFNFSSIFFFLILSIYFKEFIYLIIYLISNLALENVKKKYILQFK